MEVQIGYFISVGNYDLYTDGPSFVVDSGGGRSRELKMIDDRHHRNDEEQ